MYDDYKKARDTAWKVLIDCKISALPVDLNIIVKHYDIEVIRYSQCSLTQIFKPEIISGDGFITEVNGRKIIFINDMINTRGRRRFTLAHELGHGILNHPLNNIVARNNEYDLDANPLETQANVFSRDILAPACVLEAIGIKTADEIMRICDISRVSAGIRLERLELLRKRGSFEKSPLERQVFAQFKDFIEKIKNTPHR